MDTYKCAETEAISSVRSVILHSVKDQPEASIAGGSALILFALPVTRRFILRQTILRFRSIEGQYNAALRKKTVLTESIELQLKEANKLLERAKLAKEELRSGQEKLKAARGQLESLQTRLYKTDHKAWTIMDDLSYIRTNEAATLKSEVQLNRSIVQKQNRQVQKFIKDIANYQI